MNMSSGTRSPPLTHRQREALDFIRASIAARGYPPTLREIGDHMGIRSTNGVSDCLRGLVRKGVLTIAPGRSRAIRLVGEATGAEASSESELERLRRIAQELDEREEAIRAARIRIQRAVRRFAKGLERLQHEIEAVLGLDVSSGLDIDDADPPARLRPHPPG